MGVGTKGYKGRRGDGERKHTNGTALMAMPPDTISARRWKGLLRGLGAFYIALGALVCFGALAYYYTTYSQLYQERYQVVSAIGALKIDQITQWKNERLADAIRSARSPYFIEGVAAWLHDRDNEELAAELQQRLELERSAYQYADVLLVDGAAQTLIAANPAPLESGPELLSAVKLALEAQTPQLSHLYAAPEGAIYTDVLMPLPLPASHGPVFLVLRANLNDQLFPIIRAWPTTSPTAEAFLLQAVDDHVVFLSGLRHATEPAFSMQFPLDATELPAVQAARGRQGLYEGVDYRGEEVIADLRAVSDTPWFLVTKIDRSEVVDEARVRAVLLATIGALSLLLAAIAGGERFRRRESQLYRRLYEQEHAERIAHETFRTILYSIGDGVITTDPDARVRHMNAVAEFLTGWCEADASGLPLEDVFRIVNEETREVVASPVARVIAENGTVGLANHTLLIDKNGIERPIADSGAPILAKDGTLTGVVLVFRDQSAERAAEDQLRASEAMFRTVFDQQFQFMAILDREGHVMEINDLPLAATGAAREDIVGRLFWECPWWEGLPEMQAAWPERIERAAQCRDSILTDDRFRDASGAVREAEAAITAIFDAEGEAIQFIVQASDVTERLRAEEELRETARQLQNAQRIARVGHWELDISDDKLLWSDSIFEIFGTTRDQFNANFAGFMEMVHPDDRAAMVAAQERTLQEGVPLDIEHRIVRRDGQIRYVHERAELLDDHPVARILSGTVQDITERRLAEAAVRVVTERLKGVLDYSPLIISEVDLEGRYLLINRAGCDYIGLSAEDIVGKRCDELLPPDVATLFMARLKAVVDGCSPAIVEDTLMFKGEKRIFSTVLFPLQDDAGRVYSVGGIAQDVTSKVLADQEQQQMAEQLRQAQKMEAVGRLAGGVAHDFNNMLGVILGHAELLLEDMDAENPLYEDLNAIVHAAKRSASLTSQLLAFARKQTTMPQVLDLNQTIDGMLRMVSRLITENIELVWKPQPDLWRVRVDPAQLDQILVNLTINARDAIEGSGRITIETANVVFDDSVETSYLDRKPGAYVCLSVTDTGKGIPREDMPRLFEPFFTTKPQGEGTGLGLATVYGIVSQNQGFITVYSEVDLGATIKVYFPHFHDVEIAQPETDPPVEAPTPSDVSGQETVLLVEDEPALLQLATRLLEQQGYTVLAVGDPRKALEVAEKHESEIHLLMTDVVMPGMSGRECWEKLHARYPHLKCLFMSGYTADVIAHHGVIEAGIAFIQKPFTGKMLGAKLREVLGGDAQH